jgi:uncharacterized tellurite resistance protein B-like protein
MGFWDLFSNKNDSSSENKHSSLHYELKEKFFSLEESELIKVTCIAGLLARVAYVDFRLDPEEETNMKFALKEMTTFSTEDIDSIVEISIKHIKELAGLENHKYVYSLKEILDKNARYEVVVALFYLAAADGVVENLESEEIRLIVKGLDLGDQHFLAARAKVSDKLGALKR